MTDGGGGSGGESAPKRGRDRRDDDGDAFEAGLCGDGGDREREQLRDERQHNARVDAAMDADEIDARMRDGRMARYMQRIDAMADDLMRVVQLQKPAATPPSSPMAAATVVETHEKQ
jgi:hypothetical protein